MDEISYSNKIILILLLLFVSGFFCLAEGSLFSLGRHQLEMLKKEGKKTYALIEKLLREPYKLIITIFFADEVVNVAYSSVIGITVAALLEGYSEKTLMAISVAIASPTLLLLGEIGPKTLGVKYPKSIATAVSYPMYYFH